MLAWSLVENFNGFVVSCKPLCSNAPTPRCTVWRMRKQTGLFQNNESELKPNHLIYNCK